MRIDVRRLAAILAFSLALFLAGQNALAAEKKPGKPPVFEVPTFGKIMDVQYRPEFDEWWVKCREGNDIAIYSYEKMTRKWSKVLFTPKKPDEKAKQAEGAPEFDTGSPSGDAGIGPPKEDKKQDSGKTEGPKKQSVPDGKKDGEKKWWDPLNLIKGGERLIHPTKPPESK
jgi:hypothetical protein